MVMMDILDDIAQELEDVRADQSDLEESLDAVSDDLNDVEMLLYEMREEDGEEEENSTRKIAGAAVSPT